MESNVNITSKGIQKILKNYNPKLAIAEFIWNGFDAHANTIELNYTVNEFDGLENLEIIDNGYGINFEHLPTKFKLFYESEKIIEITSPKHTSTLHGKNGIGRLTFFTFAQIAKWETTYQKGSSLKSGSITIDSTQLNTYNPIEFEHNLKAKGTKVVFSNIHISKPEFEDIIIPFLKSEFCWFLELNKTKNYAILINGIPLDYSSNIVDYEEDIEFIYSENNTKFCVKYIQWNEILHKELSKIYFLNSSQIEMYKDFTTLNNKGDQYYHSIYVQSSFFNNFDFKSTAEDNQVKLFSKAKSSPEYKFLIKKLNDFLRVKRKPFLRQYASRLVEQYEQDGVLPSYTNEWEEKFKKPQLEEIIIGLYEAQPKLFISLNIEQKKTFVRLLDLVLDSNERDNLFKIVEEIVDLDTEERESLAKLFQTTKLDRIINTIKLIEDRYSTVNMLKELVFNPDLKANEVNHLQSMIESHYWLFGEQYHLLTAAEPKFEEALRRYTYHLTKNDVSIEIDHPHRLKEMDIFACRQNHLKDKIENIVVELKHPKIKLGANQYNQVYNYLDVILKQPEFNAPNMCWEFYLVGNDFDSSNFIKNLISTNKLHGTPSLIQSLEDGRIKVYAKKWSEIFADFEIKHKYLNDKLQLERKVLISHYSTANEIILLAANNTAIQPKEILIENA